MRLEFLGNCVIFFAAAFAVLDQDTDASTVGLSLTYVPRLLLDRCRSTATVCIHVLPLTPTVWTMQVCNVGDPNAKLDGAHGDRA
jgi:hypothetical protein